MLKKMTFDVHAHQFVCKHSKISEAEKETLLKKYEIRSQDLPKILQQDPAIIHLTPKEGDVIKIERLSKTAGTTVYYRLVVEG